MRRRQSEVDTGRWPVAGGRCMAAALSSLVAVLPGAALAHDGVPPAPHDLWYAWTLKPVLLIGLALGIVAYSRGLTALWARAGGGGVRPWQALAFAGGTLALLIALVSPLDALGAALFSAHMAQHMLLVLVAPPLLVLGRPLVVLAWALTGGRRPRPGVAAALRLVHRPLRLLPGGALLPLAVALHVVAVWFWHAPPLYEAALWNEALHAAEHTTFLGTALLVWWAIINSRGRVLGSTLALFVLTIQGGLLGALLTFAPTPWYPVYASWTESWGLTPLVDQQIAGIIMWLPGGLVYLLAALVLLGIWLGRPDRPPFLPAADEGRASRVGAADR